MKSRRHNFDTKSTGTTSTDHACIPALLSYIVGVHMLVFIFRYYNNGSDTHVYVFLHIYVETEKNELTQESYE